MGGRNRCPHGKLKSNCVHCKPCAHGKLKKDCVHCSGCPHRKLKQHCVDCSPCAHGKLKKNCVDCSGCPHRKLKYNCVHCSGCPHGKRGLHNCAEGLQALRARQGEEALRGLQRLPAPQAAWTEVHRKVKKDCVDCSGCPHRKLDCVHCSGCPQRGTAWTARLQHRKLTAHRCAHGKV